MVKIFILAVFLVTGCGIKPVLHTAADIARAICEQTVAGHTEILQGKTEQELCALDRVLAPFLDEVLSAQKRGLARVSAKSAETPKADASVPAEGP